MTRRSPRLVLCVLAVATLASCRGARPHADGPVPVDVATLTPIGDATHWVLRDPLRVRLSDSSHEIIIPAGFVTDFASIPPALRSLISPLGPHLVPSIVHDYLYWNQTCTRRQADQIFRTALEEMEVSALSRGALYRGVRTPLGRRAWRSNTRDREAGMPRIIPRSGVRRLAARETWPDYRRYLQSQAVEASPGGAVSDAFCEQGGPRESPADA